MTTISQGEREDWRKWIANTLAEADSRPGWKEALDFDGAKDWCEAMTRLLDVLEETEAKLRVAIEALEDIRDTQKTHPIEEAEWEHRQVAAQALHQMKGES